MFCTHCGSRNGEYDRFCTSCGAKLEEMPPAGVNAPHNGTDEGSVDQIPSVQEPMQDATGDAESQVVTESASEPVQPEHSQPALPQPDVARSKPAQSEPDVTHDADEAGETDETDGEADDFDTIPLQSVADEVVEAVDEPAQDEPAQNTEAATNTTDSTDSVANGKSRSKLSRRGVVLVVVAVVVLVAAAVAGVVTYRMELWGGRSLPRVSAGSSVSGRAPSARSVAKQLGDRGFKASRKQVFSGERKGAFLGYEGARGGERVRAGQRVVVRESAGPGVPSDTVGRQASVVAGELRGMGVPVRYKQVAVSRSGKVKPGSVVATYPEPGYGVTDTKTGIYVGVAVRSDDGLPADIVGRGVSDVKADLEAKGYTVKTEARFSSKKYFNKVTSSDPGLGSTLNKGQQITLYYGVGADQVKQVMTTSPQDGYVTAFGVNSAVAGTYCKAKVSDASKDCVTLQVGEYPSGYSSDTYVYRDTGDGSDDSKNALNQCFASNGGDIGRCSLSISDLPDYRGGMTRRLISRNWGAFDFGVGGEGATCGSRTISTWFHGCPSGVVTDDPDDGLAGATFDMHDFYVYFAAGANVGAVENSGYFDKDALAQAKKQHKVDSDRPFLLVRDSSLYDSSSVAVEATGKNGSPYVPTDGKLASSVKMKPAPSDATAYYLVEGTQPDWDTLADAKVKGVTNAGTSTSTNDKQGSSTTDKTTAQLMKQISGKYGFSSGAGGWSTQLSVRDDGAFSGQYSACALGDTSNKHPNGTCSESEFTGRFIDAKRNDDGSYDMTCDSSALAFKKTIGTKRVENGIEYTATKPYGIDPCGAFKVYPKGYDSSKLSETVKSWSTAWNDYASSGWPSELETPIIVNMEEDPNGSAEEAFYQSKYLD